SSRVGEGVCYLDGLWEWGIVGRCGRGGPAPSMRPYARFIAGFSPEQRERALGPDGLAWTDLRPAQRLALFQLPPQDTLATSALDLLRTARLSLVYAPAGWFGWQVLSNYPPRGVGPTPAEALAAARKVVPDANADRVAMSGGDLALFIRANDRFGSEILS